VDFGPTPLPVVEAVDALELIAGDRRSPLSEVLLEKFVALRGGMAPNARSQGLTVDRNSSGKKKGKEDVAFNLSLRSVFP